MKNKEYLATLSNEELAPYLVMSSCKHCESENCCTETDCAYGIAVWLEKEYVG